MLHRSSPSSLHRLLPSVYRSSSSSPLSLFGQKSHILVHRLCPGGRQTKLPLTRVMSAPVGVRAPISPNFRSSLLPTCNHRGLLLSNSPDANQCGCPLLRRDGGAILKLSWRQGLVGTHPANPVPPCLVNATENKIDPKTPYKTNKRLLNSSAGPSNGKINVLSLQQDQVSNEMKTTSKEEHDHVLLEKKSLNDHLNRINEKIKELKSHADLLKGELDKLVDQCTVVKREKNEGKAKEEAEKSSPRKIPDSQFMFHRPNQEAGQKRPPDNTDLDKRSAKRHRQD